MLRRGALAGAALRVERSCLLLHHSDCISALVLLLAVEAWSGRLRAMYPLAGACELHCLMLGLPLSLLGASWQP